MDNEQNNENKSTADIFNIRPASVKKWIEDLPLGSTGESSKQIYHAIKKTNLQENNLDHQLAFLEALAPTLNLLYPRLSKYFTDVSLPLGTKTRNVIHVTSSLLNQVLLGYHTVLKNLITNKPFGWKKPFSLALHRSFIYSSQILCTHRLSYQPQSKGIWRQIYWSYQQATNLKLLKKAHFNKINVEQKTSVDYEFKRLLLLSLLSTNDLSQKGMQEIHDLMPLWIKHSEILNEEPTEKATCFTLNLLSDISPYLIGTRNDAGEQVIDRHYLSTFKLKNLLTGYLNKLEDDGSIKVGKNILSKTTIQSLLLSWSRSTLRAEVRKQGAGFVDIITGITAIHFVLNQQDQPSYDEVSVDSTPDKSIDFESTLTIEPINHSHNSTLSLEHFLSDSDQKEDVWNKAYETSINEALPVANWTETGSFQTYEFTKSILLDYSKDGYRLSVNANKVDSLKHNELIAVREHALAPWALAQVKWLHYSKRGDVQFGLRILTHHVLPVHVSYEANNGLSKPLPCLLGLDRKELMLFVPTLPTNLSNKKLQLDHQKQHSHIHLKNKILTTSAFDAYTIFEPKTKHKASAQAVIEPNNKANLGDAIWENF